MIWAMAQAMACIKTVRLCVMSAAHYGLDSERLLGECGLSPGQLLDPYLRVPHELVARLWTEVPRLTGDEAFGLHTAERWHTLTLSAFDGAFYHSRSIGDAMATLVRYVRLLHEAGVVRIEQQGDAVACSERWECQPEMPHQFREMVIAMWVLRLGRLLGRALPLREVSLRSAPPRDDAEHRRLLGPKLRFGAAMDGITLDADCMSAPVQGADATLGLVLKRHLQDELARLPSQAPGPASGPAPTSAGREDDLLVAAERAIRESLGDPGLDIDRLARRLATSRRTLQRRLREAGTTFHALVDSARRESALSYLHDRRLTLAEVAFNTGYSEMSTFFRAFRRWTGQTPREYQSAQRQ